MSTALLHSEVAWAPLVARWDVARLRLLCNIVAPADNPPVAVGRTLWTVQCGANLPSLTGDWARTSNWATETADQLSRVNSSAAARARSRCR